MGATGELHVTGRKRPEVSVLTGTTRHPHLTDHTIDDRVVVPAAFALDWFARAARELWPERPIDALAEFQVLAGLRPGPTELLTIVAKENGAMIMLASGGRPAYRCRVARTDEHATLIDPPRSEARDGSLAAYGSRLPYGESLPNGGRRLFHGPSFHVIQSLDEVEDKVVRATLRTASSVGWKPEPWLVDPALVDGVMQLLVSSVAARHGVPSVPTNIDYIRWNRDAVAPSTSACSCSLFGQEKSADRVVADAVVDSGDGSRIIDLRGITFHILPE